MKRMLYLTAFSFLILAAPAFAQKAGDLISASHNMICFVFGRTMVCLTPTSSMMCNQVGNMVHCSQTAVAPKPVTDADEWREWIEDLRRQIDPLDVEIYKAKGVDTDTRDLWEDTMTSDPAMGMKLREKLSSLQKTDEG